MKNLNLSIEDLKNWFLPNIQKMVRKTIREESQITMYKGIVDSTSTDYATITLHGDSVQLVNVVNKTKEVLSIGDRVLVYAMNNDLGNAIIAFRLENNIT